ncbi:MAG: 2-oxo acid dehydrogenase subunit E2 [Caldilineaceae bacterium]
MTQSWRSAPGHLHQQHRHEPGRGPARPSQQRRGGASGARASRSTILIAKAVTVALARHPRLNAWLHEDGRDLVLTEHGHVNLGMAVALEDGLIVPVVKDADAEAGRAGRAVYAVPTGAGGHFGPGRRHGRHLYDFESGHVSHRPLHGHHQPAPGGHHMRGAHAGAARVGRRGLPAHARHAGDAGRRSRWTGAVATAFLGEIKRLLEEPARMLV